MPPTPPDQVPELASVARRLGLSDVAVLRRTDKTLLAAAELGGEPVVVKLLLDDSEFWAAKWRHEIGVYRAFEQTPPPVRAPRLVHTDDGLLVLERIDAQPVDSERYPPRRLTDTQVELVTATLRRLNAWQPPAGRFARIFDYPDRVRRYHAAGYLTDDDSDALRRLLDRCGDTWEFNHGDPLPSNLLLTRDGACALVDWEFAGLYLPGFDLAMLRILLGASAPTIGERVEEAISAGGLTCPFAINMAMALTRELRIHHELPESPTRAARLHHLNDAWARTREQLRVTARKDRS